MPLTLPTGKQIKVKLIINGEETTKDITTLVGRIAPGMTIPSALDVIRNTSVQDPKDFSNVQFRALAKTEPKVTYRNGEVVVEPGKMDRTKAVRLNVAQLAPCRIAEVIPFDDIDVQQPEFDEIVAKVVANWFPRVNTDIETNALEKLAYEAQEFQKTLKTAESSATTFKTGSHVEEITELTVEKAYNAFLDLKHAISKIGTKSAKSNIDKTFKFASGINLNDIVVLVSPEFKDTLLQYPGLFASDSGIEIFKTMGIKIIAGLNVLEMSTMPDKVHAIAVVVGEHGTYGKGSVGDSQHICLRADSSWSKNKELELEKSYYSDVVYKQLIYAIFENGATFHKPDTLSDQGYLTSYGVETYHNIEKQSAKSSNVQAMSEEVKEKAKQSLGQKAIDKAKEIKDKVVEAVSGKENSQENKEEPEQENK